MTIHDIEKDFRATVADTVRVAPEGLRRFRVFTPFVLTDGDHLSIVLKQDDGGWFFSDEGNSLMRLTYDVPERALHRGRRQTVIGSLTSMFGVENREGELVLRIADDQYGGALYSFSQALLQILDLSYLNQERGRSKFASDFKELMTVAVPASQRVFDWTDSARDSGGNYPVDCRIDVPTRPLFVHALSSDRRTARATIVLHQFEKWQAPFQSLGIFENQEAIDRRVLARYTDVCDRMFSSIRPNHDRIIEFVKGVTGSGGA